jgi:RimJ/RimL family protein N-acetyltransferase/catechol 2,3-dioxygenase-like lactoylglutathione lyase family enzyme
MHDHPALETERLVLLPLSVEHARALHAVYADPRAMRFWHTPLHRSPAETRAMIVSSIEGRERAWVLVPRSENAPVGLIHFLGEGQLGATGLGYILHPAHWGRGLMSEAVAAVLDFGFDHLNLDRVELWIDARNHASQAVARRAGFTFRGVFRQKHPHADTAIDTLVFGLRIEQRRPGASPRRRPPIRSYGLVPVLPVPDVRATAEFYRDRLGFAVQFLFGEPPTYGAMLLGEWSVAGAVVHFVKSDAPPAVGLTLFIHAGPGIDGLCEHYRARGVAIVDEPATRPWGIRDFTLADCNGYRLRFGTPT